MSIPVLRKWRVTACLAAMSCGWDCPRSKAAAPENRAVADYLVQAWETVDGLPDNSATAIVQSPDGYLWTATFGGLTRFNGDSFTVFNPDNTPGLPSGGIVSLHLDRRGWLWASTYEGLAVRDGEKWRQLGKADGWTTGELVRTFSERPNGDLFLTTFDGHCFEFAGGRFTQLPEPPGESGHGYFGGVDEDGRWWVVQNKFTGRLEDDRWVSMMSSQEVSSEETGCAPARQGGMWILLGRELRRIKNGMEVSRISLPETTGGVWSMTEDSRGNIWFASHNRGFSRLAPDGTMARLDSAAGVSDQGRCLFEDREKNLWLGTSGDGLLRLRPQRFKYFELHRGRKGPVVNSIWPEGDRMLAATYGEGLFLFDQQGTSLVTLPSGQAIPGYLQSVLRDRTGRLWLGTFAGGLWLVEGDRARQFPAEKTGGNNVVALFEDSRGHIWVSGGGEAAVFDGSDFRTIVSGGGLRAGGISCFAEDGDGAVWATTGESVLRQEKNGGLTEVLTSSGEPVGRIRCLAPDSTGGMWLGSSNRGLLRWKAGALAAVDSRVGFPVEGIAGIVADDSGNFWMTSGRSVVRAAVADLNKAADGGKNRLVCQVFNASDGVPHAEFTSGRQPSCLRDARGRLWFAGARGVVMTDPAELILNEVLPTVRVTGLTFDTPETSAAARIRAVREGGEAPVVIRAPFPARVTLPPGSRHIAIQYEALSFAAPEKVRFQYRLDGANWIDAGAERNAAFFELPPATYHFHVRAANNDGVWNETGASISFVVQPHYWQTWWFRAGGAALLLVSGGALAWWRARVRHRRQIARMERARQQQAEVAHLSRVATMGQLASALAHEINQPLGAILRNTEAAELFLQSPNPDLEELRAIVADIQRDDQRAGAVIDRMRALLKRRNIETRPLEVSALTAETVSVAQSDARSRQVRLLVNIPPGLPLVRGDRVHLQQVLLNLLINAMDALKDSPEGRRTITVGAVNAGPGFVGFSVRDTGPGISPDKLAQVFDPFFTSKSDGMGVGLAISRTIIEAHGGRIWAENVADGTGAIFRFTVPAAEENSEVS